MRPRDKKTGRFVKHTLPRNAKGQFVKRTKAPDQEEKEAVRDGDGSDIPL